MQKVSMKNISKIKVSSVLNKDVKNYGKNNIFDGNQDTCWNSDEGKPQWVLVEFNETLQISSFKIEFQGGFVGQNCQVIMSLDGEIISEPFYPEDMNGIQEFSLSKSFNTNNLKFLFNDSTDFFGRIIIYSISIYTS